MDNLFFNDEHKMIKNMVRQFAETKIMPVARDLDEKERGKNNCSRNHSLKY